MAGLPPLESRRRGPRDPDYRDDAILVAVAHLDRVKETLRELYGDVALREQRKGAIVVLRSERDFDAGAVVDAVRQRCAERFDGFKPTLSPRHLVAIGQPNVRGNPEGQVPREIEDRALPPRTSVEGEGIVVAIVDTGIAAHPWLEDAYVALPGDFEHDVTVWEEEATPPGRYLGEQAGHGLFLAGLVLEQAPGATVKVFRTATSDGRSEIDDVTEAIVRAAGTGAHVVNLSLGCFTRRDMPPWTLLEALEALPKTTAVVASAGNSEAPASFWPAGLKSVTGVGALAETDGAWRLASYSNRGAWVDVYVPATNVLSTYIDWAGSVLIRTQDGKLCPEPRRFRGWAEWSGTSMAAARWSGAVARAAAAWEVSAVAAERRILELPGSVGFARVLELPVDERDELDSHAARLALDFIPPQQQQQQQYSS
jgi:subtilisin family serine protease